MEQKDITKIIAEIKSIQSSLSQNSDLHPKFNSIIEKLEKLRVTSSFDKNIDRTKKINDIISVYLKLLFDYFKDS